MYYRNFTHQETYLELIYETEKGGSNAYVSAFYILTLPEIYGNAKDYIYDGQIDFDKILDQEWTESMRFLLEVAQSLFYAKGRIEIADFLFLDMDDFNVFREAIDLRYDAASLKGRTFEHIHES